METLAFLIRARMRATLVMAALMVLPAILAMPDTAIAQAQGQFADKRMQDFEKRRACEQNLPTCLPQVRMQMEQERTNQMWMGAMIAGMLTLVGLVIYRANQRKQQEERAMMAKRRQKARLRKQGDAGDGDEPAPENPKLARSKLERPPRFSQR